MAHFKKNQMNQILFVAVDGTDFATIESGITASDFDSGMTKKFFGVNHGVSTAETSGAISKAVQLVRSGVFRQTLKASECNFDFVLFSFKGHASMADLTFPVSMDTYDDSDLMSRISDTASDLKSALTVAATRQLLIQSMVSDVDSQLNLNASMISDAMSAAQQASSRILVVQSMVSDIDSDLSNAHSDLRSLVSGITASVGASDISDIASAVQAILASRLSDTLSAAQQANSRALVVQSMVSDVQSALDSQFVYLSAAISDMQSDLRSVVSDQGISTSDIASGVWAQHYAAHSLASSFGSLFSVVGTDAGNAASRALVVQSMVSDVDSQLLLNASMISDVQSALDSQFVYVSNVLSDMQSDLRSLVSTSGGAVTVSNISDIASAVQAIQASRMSDILSAAQAASSRALVIQSFISDVDSALTSQFNALSNMVSDAQSDIRSIVSDQGGAVTVSNISDIASAVWANATRVLTSQLLMNASDISDLRSAIAAGPAATITASDISDIASAVQAIQASRLSDILSAAQAGNTNAAAAASRALLIQSLVSDIDSQLLLTASGVSDVQSALDSQFVYLSAALSDMQSNLRSAVSTVGGGVTVSNISDIVSGVWAAHYAAHSLASSFGSLFSLMATDADQGNSRALVVQSVVSDVQSQLDLNASAISDVQSALDSQFAYLSDSLSGVDAQLLLNASLASDAASAAQQGSSRALVLQSRLSDMDSQLNLNASVISDVQSQVDLNASMTSDAASAAQQANSRALVIQSLISDVDSQINAGVSVLGGVSLTASGLSDVVSAMWARGGADPSGVPVAGASMGDKLDWVAALSRNKITQTSALQIIRNDADGANIASAIVSDDGTTATREEWV